MQFHRLILMTVVTLLTLMNITVAQSGSAPTAEDVLKALQKHRPLNEVIPPVMPRLRTHHASPRTVHGPME